MVHTVKAMPLSKKSGTTFNDSEKEVLLQYNQDYEIVSAQRYRVNDEYYYNVVAVLKGEHEYGN